MRAVVLGGGAWGTALAIQAVRAGIQEVTVWARDPEVVEAINTEHENTRYFKGHALPHCIRATTDKQGAITSSSGTVLILLVVPTPAIAAVVADLKLGPEHILVSCTKGILNDTLETPDEGVKTSKSAHELAAKLGVETPVITGIYQVIHEGAKPLEVLRANMKRPLRQEALY